jgi:phosphoribosylglycinamide formyltransferase-1
MSDRSTRRRRLVILISGGGSNLQSFMDACAEGSLNAEIAAVISNKVSAKGLERAANAGIPNIVLDHTEFPSRGEFDAALGDIIDSFSPDLVILAGFMRILTPPFVNRFLGRLMNIHPSLLPKYPGLHTHQRAIDAGDKKAGATVHFVTAELDGGPAIVQAQVKYQYSKRIPPKYWQHEYSSMSITSTHWRPNGFVRAVSSWTMAMYCLITSYCRKVAYA